MKTSVCRICSPPDRVGQIGVIIDRLDAGLGATRPTRGGSPGALRVFGYELEEVVVQPITMPYPASGLNEARQRVEPGDYLVLKVFDNGSGVAQGFVRQSDGVTSVESTVGRGTLISLHCPDQVPPPCRLTAPTSKVENDGA